MPKIVRVMKASDGKPGLGASATTLGVRPDTDIPIDPSGNVQPATGGMSVSPSLLDLPARLIPTRLRHLVPRAAGSNSLSVWSMGSGPFAEGPVTADLQLRLDPARSTHGFVEPGAAMSFDDYQMTLQATQNDWSIEEG
jgi:hypothetical protein